MGIDLNITVSHTFHVIAHFPSDQMAIDAIAQYNRIEPWGTSGRNALIKGVMRATQKPDGSLVVDRVDGQIRFGGTGDRVRVIESLIPDPKTVK